MTVAHVYTVAFQGIEAREVDVQVHVGDAGSVQFNIVGLADKAVAESRERVRAALTAIGLALPFKRITVNLAPADLPKEGSHYDLPIALGLLAAMGVLPASEMANYVAVGELSLDAQVTAVAGVLNAALAASTSGRGLICPAACGAEAAWAGDLSILATPSLIALVNHMKGTSVLTPPTPKLAETTRAVPDLRDVKGQESAKRALEIAAAGGHNLLMIGPPGAGKSMLAQRLPGLLPPLDAREALEISMVRSLAGELTDGAISRDRPFRNPHHSASMAALVGGGLKVRPGEVSLAHLARRAGQSAPADRDRRGRGGARQCPCAIPCALPVGGGDESLPLRLSHRSGAGLLARAQMRRRLPDAHLGADRIDLHVEVAGVAASDLALPAAREGSAEVAARVARARDIQRARFEVETVRTNAEAEGELLDRIATPEPGGAKLLTDAAERIRLSARGYSRVLRVARTIADLAGSLDVMRPHIAEALSYRRLALQS